MDFLTPEDRAFLQQLGRTEYGRDLVLLLRKARTHFESIKGIDARTDVGAQVEGRKIMGTFITDLVAEIETRKRIVKEKEQDDFT